MNINGITTILNHNLPNIEGGFGEGKRGILVKSIAGLHQRTQDQVSRAIKQNQKRLKDGVDLIDIKSLILNTTHCVSCQLKQQLIENEVITQDDINRSKNIWLLSERGYAKLTKIFDDDLSWDVMDALVDGYFSLREQQVKVIQVFPYHVQRYLDRKETVPIRHFAAIEIVSNELVLKLEKGGVSVREEMEPHAKGARIRD